MANVLRCLSAITMSSTLSKGRYVVPFRFKCYDPYSLLLERGVIPPSVDEHCNTRDGIQKVVGYLRNKDFETFLKFVECICIADTGVNKKILDSIFCAVQDFDARKSTQYSVRVEQIIKKAGESRYTWLKNNFSFQFYIVGGLSGYQTL